ncbi:hypothetical protein, partial [Streptomyces sp. N35]|uniref:hypothetical protein n=1 Tax=Streptomyces sp. N35 TaxID=2795730 RepID=UPI001F192E17
VNLALTFGTLLSSQGTDASFVLTLSGFPPGFPSVFPTLSDSFGPDSQSDWDSLSGVSAFRRFPFPARPTLSEFLDRSDRPWILMNRRGFVRNEFPAKHVEMKLCRRT